MNATMLLNECDERERTAKHANYCSGHLQLFLVSRTSTCIFGLCSLLPLLCCFKLTCTYICMHLYVWLKYLCTGILKVFLNYFVKRFVILISATSVSLFLIVHVQQAKANNADLKSSKKERQSACSHSFTWCRVPRAHTQVTYKHSLCERASKSIVSALIMHGCLSYSHSVK